MLLSASTHGIASRFGMERALEILAEAGFDAYDFSCFDMEYDDNCPMNRDDYLDFVAATRKKAASLGLVCNQAHAPFPSSYGDAQKDEVIFAKICRSMEAAALLGAKIIVVHPCQHLSYMDHADLLFEMNMAFYRRLIPFCEKYGIAVAMENMWRGRPQGGIVSSTCASPDEFVAYLDEVNSPYVVGCLDLGHTVLTGVDPALAIKKLGKDRLRALHIHDNDYINDTHTLPYLSKMPFDSIFAALKEIGYEGDFTYECDGFYQNMPDEFISDAAAFVAKAGRIMMKKITD